MVTTGQVEKFLQNPSNFLYAADWREEVFRFVPASRQALSDLSFLDNRTLGQSRRKGALPFYQVIPLAREFQGRCDFIFHSAFCCSTLLARCLETPGRVLALKEPLAILNLSGFLRSENEAAGVRFHDLAETTLRLLARPFSNRERVLIKPSNGANNLIGDFLKNPACGKVLLLYGPLEDFLVSVITGGDDRQKFIDGILPLFIKDFGAGLKIPELKTLSPLDRAALVWGLQIQEFSRVAAIGNENVKVLNIKDFFADPAQSLEPLNKFFDYGYSGKNIKEILSGPVLTTHAKEPHRIFSFKDREIERLETLKNHKKEIGAAKAVLKGFGLANHGFQVG